MEEKVKDILASMVDGADTEFSQMKGITQAFVAQEAEEIMKLHREVLGKYARKINDICEEFAHDPVACLGIIQEHLNGSKETIF